MPAVSRVVLLAKTRQTFFEHPVLDGDLRHDLLQLAVLRAEFLDFVTGRLPTRVSSQLLLASLEEVLAPAVLQVGRDALSAAQLRDTLLSAQPLEHDPDLLLRSELSTGPTADLTNCGFRGLLLRSRHMETLLGVRGPRKVSLRLGHPNVRLLLTGNIGRNMGP